MPDLWGDPNWWAPSAPAQPVSLGRLVRDGVMDARLAALVWLLVEGGLPVVVAGEGRRLGKTTLLTALLGLLPAGAPYRVLEGEAEDFAWLPQAPELGWPRSLAVSLP
ncbi:MAG TPA: hypothetical protein VFW86_06435, partial [Candidatus Limnocylindrales bacterium]|nr:hypothetical protein [Candidatus Limnocylindrales bacterium]